MMLSISNNNLGKLDKIPIFIIVMVGCIRLYSPTVNSMVLNFVLPLIMIWCVISTPRVLKDLFVKQYVILILWMMVTVLTSVNVSNSIDGMKSTIGGFVTSTIMYALASKSLKNSYWLMLSYVLTFAATLYYLYSSGILLDIDTERARLSTEGVNANDLAYYLFYITIVVALFYWNGFDGLKFWLNVPFLLLIITALFVSIITASRQVLLVVVPFLLLTYIFRSVKSFRLSKILPLLVLLILSLVAIFYFKTNYYDGSYLQLRMEDDVKEDNRLSLMQSAIEVGISNIFFGVGPNNFVLFSGGSFSHCSYTELFATSGLLASLFFLRINIGVIRQQYKRYKITRNRVFLYLFISSIVWSLYNVFYAFYTAVWLIPFYFLLIGYSDCCYKNLTSQVNVRK